MKVRIYAVTPETEAGQMDTVSGVMDLKGPEDVANAALAVMQLWPEWTEINIERVVD